MHLAAAQNVFYNVGSLVYNAATDAYTLTQEVVETGAKSTQIVKCQSGKKYVLPYVVYEKVRPLSSCLVHYCLSYAPFVMLIVLIRSPFLYRSSPAPTIPRTRLLPSPTLLLNATARIARVTSSGR